MIPKVAEEVKQAKSALDAATKAAQAAAAELKKAQQSKAGVDEAGKKAKAAEDAQKAATAKHKAVTDKNTRLQAAKKAADKKVADVKKANAPKDINFAIFSTPIRLRIVDTPLKLTAKAPGAIKPGAKVNLPVMLQRLYGFADQVEVLLELPKGVQGLSVAKINIAKDKQEGTLQIAADGKASPGSHTVTIRAKAKFNKIDVQATQQVVVKVEAAAK